MAIANRSIQVVLTGSGDTLAYQAPPNTSTTIITASAANAGVNASLVDGHLVLGGGAGTATNLVTHNQPVAAGDSKILPELIGLQLSPGDQIRTNLDTTGNVTVTLSIREFV